MRRLFCLICPPLAVLLCFKPVTAFCNALMCLFGWFPGVIHAWGVVDDYHADKRNKKLVGTVAGLQFPLYAKNERILQPQKVRKRKRGYDPSYNALVDDPNHSCCPHGCDDPSRGEGGTQFRKR